MTYNVLFNVKCQHFSKNTNYFANNNDYFIKNDGLKPSFLLKR